MKRPGGKIVLLVLAAAVLPGLGHVLLGRRARGGALFAVVLATALVGIFLEPRNLSTATYEYGRTYLFVAAIMQLLLVLDVYERASGRRA
ncbi:MAG: hypothetical protein NEA02_15780 [Thermoanaerobaculia bacterium]|nr:hypothetical protein [Thermoanaerobaculia bacterium]